MTKNRMEAFSDGVLAIIITIMVLELRPPEGAHLSDLAPLLPKFLSYVLSFIYVGIYWNNHHHLLRAARTITGPILWANLLLLFWLSLTPFTAAWMGENHLASAPVALYGGVLIAAALSYTLLVRMLIAHEGPDSLLAQAVGADFKGWISVVLYAAGVGLSFIQPLFGFGLYILVAAIWFIPDRRIEKRL